MLPGTATLVGTVRTFDPQVQEMVEKRLELCSAIALGFGATATVHYERIYPATINSERAKPSSRAMWPNPAGCRPRGARPEPSMGAEDSFMLQNKPALYLRIGQGKGRRAACCTTAAMTSTTTSFRWAPGVACEPDRAGHAPFRRTDRMPSLHCLHRALRANTLFTPEVFVPFHSTLFTTKRFPRNSRKLAVTGRCAGCGERGSPGSRPCASPTRAMRCRWTRTAQRILQLSVTSNVYEPRWAATGPEPAPALATSWKQIAPTVWRFELRKGVQFHDGTPFTADDVCSALPA